MKFSGNRQLIAAEDVWKHNSWDDVQWDPIQLQTAKDIVFKHQGSSQPSKDISKMASKWNSFYTNNTRNFFKDRHWYEYELSSLLELSSSEQLHIFEIGCGTGSSIFPLLSITSDRVSITGCDFSTVAVDLVKCDERYDSKRCNVFCHDISDSSQTLPLTDNSVDLVLFVFVLSAIPKELMEVAMGKALKVLRPGGRIFIRDYGLYDLAQLRMPASNWIEGNQYKRGDNTLTYFFTKDELEKLVVSNPSYLMRVYELKEDKRLLVNRKRQLQMYRVWIQGIFYKQV